ncbi:MAG: response regulator [Deltaproteobacteria bacterium]|nr:response regulator [Deltaproteobacteria bacterium]
MATLKRVLILEENTDHLELLTSILEDHFSPIDIHTVESIEDCLDFLEQTAYDLIITGYYIHSTPISERLGHIVERAGGTAIIVISGSGDETIAAQMIKLGASDYLVKNKKTLEKIPALVSKYFKKVKSKTPPAKQSSAAAETSTRLLREIDHLMQKARAVTANIASKPESSDTLNLEVLFSQIKRLRKIIQEQK